MKTSRHGDVLVIAIDNPPVNALSPGVPEALGHFSDPSQRKPLVHDRLVEMGRLGQKRGKGWYRYDDPRTPTPDPAGAYLLPDGDEIGTIVATNAPPRNRVRIVSFTGRPPRDIVVRGAKELGNLTWLPSGKGCLAIDATVCCSSRLTVYRGRCGPLKLWSRGGRSRHPTASIWRFTWARVRSTRGC